MHVTGQLEAVKMNRSRKTQKQQTWRFPNSHKSVFSSVCFRVKQIDREKERKMEIESEG